MSSNVCAPPEVVVIMNVKLEMAPLSPSTIIYGREGVERGDEQCATSMIDGCRVSVGKEFDWVGHGGECEVYLRVDDPVCMLSSPSSHLPFPRHICPSCREHHTIYNCEFWSSSKL